MIESRNEKKEDGLRSPLTESRRGAEPKVWTPLPHVCAGVALDLTGDTIMELAAPCGAPLSRARSGSVDHRGAEPKVRTPLPHDCAGVALGMELAAPCGARRRQICTQREENGGLDLVEHDPRRGASA